jgi:hypothetical protein
LNNRQIPHRRYHPPSWASRQRLNPRSVDANLGRTLHNPLGRRYEYRPSVKDFRFGTPTHHRFRGLVRHSNRQQSAAVVQKTRGTMEGTVGSAEKAGTRTPTRLLGSYRRVFISHQTAGGIPMDFRSSSLPTPTVVSIPIRLPTQPIRCRPHRPS